VKKRRLGKERETKIVELTQTIDTSANVGRAWWLETRPAGVGEKKRSGGVPPLMSSVLGEVDSEKGRDWCSSLF